MLPLARVHYGNEYWATIHKMEEISRELGSEELKRIAMDALIEKDMEAFKCSQSNLIQLRKHMDPLYEVKAAEWCGVAPSSMLDVQLGRWRDEGQNNSRHFNEFTQEKLVKQAIIFEQDPLDSEEAFDDKVSKVEMDLKLRRFIDSGHPNLLK